jgi:hypothetical protein
MEDNLKKIIEDNLKKKMKMEDDLKEKEKKWKTTSKKNEIFSQFLLNLVANLSWVGLALYDFFYVLYNDM